MSISAKRVAEILAAFARARVAVVGDFMADVYLQAAPARLSREAPVMVVRWQAETVIPGGAANTVNNLLALGAKVVPVGTVGRDRAGRMLEDFFASRGCEATGLVVQDELATVTKTRVMVGEEGRSKQQVLRVDREPEGRPSPALREAVQARVLEIAGAVDAVLLSDYGYGLIDGALATALLGLGSRPLVTADSRYALRDFRGVDLITPNHSEAAEIVGHAVLSDEETRRAGRALREGMAVANVLVTRGNRGMMLDDGVEPCFIAASGSPAEVTDVSGAGDTVIAVATLALVSGASPREAATIANHAAGVVVTKLGAATVSPEELLRAATAGDAGAWPS